jgi:hypothetical protein
MGSMPKQKAAGKSSGAFAKVKLIRFDDCLPGITPKPSFAACYAHVLRMHDPQPDTDEPRISHLTLPMR